MTPEQMAEIRERAEAATEGPWHDEHGEYGCVTIGDFGWVTGGPRAPEYDVDSLQGRDDAEFIAHARTDVPDLIAEVERFRAGIEYLRGAVRLGARTNAEPEAVHVLQIIHDDLVELLNPTEGETNGEVGDSG